MGTCCFCPDENKHAGPFTKVVHVISETLGKKLARTISRDLECDVCNNDLSKLEQAYMRIGIEFMYRPYLASTPLRKGARRGKEASASFYDPEAGTYQWGLREGRLVLKIVRPPEFDDASKTVTLTVHREYDSRIVSRQIAKWGVEIAAEQLGIDRVRQTDFDAVREFARFDKGPFRSFLLTTVPPLPTNESASLAIVETSAGVFFFYALLGVAYVANLTSSAPPDVRQVAQIGEQMAARLPAPPTELPEGAVVKREVKCVTKQFISERTERKAAAREYRLSWGYTQAIDQPPQTPAEVLERASVPLVALIHSRFASASPTIDDLLALTRDGHNKELRKELHWLLANPAPRELPAELEAEGTS